MPRVVDALGDLAQPHPLRGQAGEQLGTVGTTGSSSACHLHFEMWTKPGWYRGGDVVSPRPYLKSWDRSS